MSERPRPRRNKVPKNKKILTSWSIVISISTFFIAVGITLISDLLLRDSTLFIATLTLFAIVVVGLVSDIIAVAITAAAAEITPFHSMAAKKIYGAKKCISILRNAEKYSNFFADVVGDICGYIAGFAGATVVVQIINLSDKMKPYESVIAILVAGFTSSAIVGSKAIGKNFAIYNKTSIVLLFGRILTLFSDVSNWKDRKSVV